MQTSNFTAISNDALDAIIMCASRDDDHDAAITERDAAIAERSRRSRVMDAILYAVRGDIEAAAVVHGVDAYLDFPNGNTAEIWHDAAREPARVPLADGVDTAVANIRAVLQGLVNRKTRDVVARVKLAPGALAMVCDELERCGDRPAYARLLLRGSTLIGTRWDLAELADGIEAVTSDEDLAFRAETIAANSKGSPEGDALEARAEFIARALRGSRDKLLRALRR